MDKKVQISREGFEKLKAERENLINVERPAVRKISLLYKKQEHKVTYQKMLTTMQQEINRLVLKKESKN